MNTQTQEALKMAIEALEFFQKNSEFWKDTVEEAIQACKEALEQPAQEPVAWLQEYENQDGDIKHTVTDECIGINDIPLYTHPAPSWQGLESEKVTQIIHGLEDKLGMPIVGAIAVARAIEQALKEKNHV